MSFSTEGFWRSPDPSIGTPATQIPAHKRIEQKKGSQMAGADFHALVHNPNTAVRISLMVFAPSECGHRRHPRLKIGHRRPSKGLDRAAEALSRSPWKGGLSSLRRWLQQDEGVLAQHLLYQTVETAGGTDRRAAVFTDPDPDSHR